MQAKTPPVSAAMKVQHGSTASQVLEAEYCAQQNVAPFLKYPVLRKIVQTFTNDEHEDFGRWANNPLAIQMLQQAVDLLDSGRVTEAEMEVHLLSQLQASHGPGSCAGHSACKHLLSQSCPQAPGSGARQEVDSKPARTVRLATEQLVPALNEHVRLRALSDSP